MKTNTSLTAIRAGLRRLGKPEDAEVLQRFFKTGPGEYGEGDVFIGIRMPVLRKLAREYEQLPVRQAVALLRSTRHEERMLALLVLVRIFHRSDRAGKKRVYDLYLENTQYINNWDLVDLSAEHIVGAYLWERSRAPLRRLAKSSDLWERRIAILATFHFIKQDEFEEALRVAEMLLNDEHDLIHKAVGWMLREIGKRDGDVERRFLKAHYRGMPRTMLRYAIERFPEPERQRYLKGSVK